MAFNPNTLYQVDRIMIFRLLSDDEQGLHIETLADFGRNEFDAKLIKNAKGELRFTTAPKKMSQTEKQFILDVAETAHFQNLTINRLINQTIVVLRDNEVVSPSKPELRKMAKELGVPLENSSGTLKNTRQLGAQIIRTINEK